MAHVQPAFLLLEALLSHTSSLVPLGVSPSILHSCSKHLLSTFRQDPGEGWAVSLLLGLPQKAALWMTVGTVMGLGAPWRPKAHGSSEDVLQPWNPGQLS